MPHLSLRVVSACWIIATVSIVGCGEVSRGDAAPMTSSASATTGPGPGPMDDTDGGTDTDVEPPEPAKLDVGASTTGLGNEDECASFSESVASTKKPADILFVVDNSPSMAYEASAVQDNLNMFSQQIVDAGIDVRVFLLSAYPDPDVAPQIDTGICIDPPLGNGQCPLSDNNPPVFSHLHANIGSSQGLSRLLDTHETWAPIVREDSVKHIIVVSDDDSYLSASDFDAQFRALDPSYANYALHGIVSLEDCVFADNVGETYVSLAEMTDGVVGDLCEQDFQPVFDLLSTAVIESSDLSCVWDIPEIPEGMVIELDAVDVHFEADDGTALDFGAVQDASACANAEHGFYYDDAASPTQLLACPQTCELIQAATDASIDIDIGCATPIEG